MWNKRGKTIKDVYEATVKHLFYDKPMENTTTIYDLNIHLEVTQPDKKDISSLLPIKSEKYIEKYEKQILEGAEQNDFSYTYHDRLTNYEGINQIDRIIDELSKNWESRQAVAITLKPKVDFIQDKDYSTMPCLNEICFNIDNERDIYMTSFFRSNDCYKALYYNMRGLIKLGEFVKEEIEDRIGKELNFKRYNHEIVNGHIYKKDLPMIKSKLSRKK